MAGTWLLFSQFYSTNIDKRGRTANLELSELLSVGYISKIVLKNKYPLFLLEYCGGKFMTCLDDTSTPLAGKIPHTGNTRPSCICVIQGYR